MPAPNRAARWAAALLAVATAAGTAACAGPPSKGKVHGHPLNQSRNNVVILAQEPTAGMSPEVLVTNFLQALTGDQQDPAFSVAQEFLTPEARNQLVPPGPSRGWVTTTKIVNYGNPVVESPPQADHSPHPTPAAAATPVGQTETVTVSGTEYAEIDSFGYFQYENQPEPVKQSFTVRYFGGETGWRIDSVPNPVFRMVSPDAFHRAYQTSQSALPVFLPSPGQPTQQMDQVYLTQESGKADYTYDALARAVLHGRSASPSSPLELQTPVTIDAAGMATVTLKPPPTGMRDLTYVQQAIASTFQSAEETQQLLAATPVNALHVTYPGCGGACKVTSLQNPLQTPPTAYWLCPVGVNGASASIVFRPLSGGTGGTVACPVNDGKDQPHSVVTMAGVNPEKNSPIAVKQSPDSPDIKQPKSTTYVAVVETNGKVVVLNDRSADQRVWYTTKDPSTVTDLEWDPVDGSLWVVDNGSLYRVQGPGQGDPSAVPLPAQQVTRFKPSPDGSHAVLVTGQNAPTPGLTGSPAPAMMVTIDRSAGMSTLDNDSAFQLLRGSTQTGDMNSNGLQSVADASWADGRTVVLLGTQSNLNTPKLYRVFVDGSQDSTIVDPQDAQPGTQRVGATTSYVNGRSSVWTFSDASGSTADTTTSTYSYFKRSNGSDSFQELGWSPVVAVTTPASG